MWPFLARSKKLSKSQWVEQQDYWEPVALTPDGDPGWVSLVSKAHLGRCLRLGFLEKQLSDLPAGGSLEGALGLDSEKQKKTEGVICLQQRPRPIAWGALRPEGPFRPVSTQVRGPLYRHTNRPLDTAVLAPCATGSGSWEGTRQLGTQHHEPEGRGRKPHSVPSIRHCGRDQFYGFLIAVRAGRNHCGIRSHTPEPG